MATKIIIVVEVEDILITMESVDGAKAAKEVHQGNWSHQEHGLRGFQVIIDICTMISF